MKNFDRKKSLEKNTSQNHKIKVFFNVTANQNVLNYITWSH